MDSKLKNRIVNSLRKMWLQSPLRTAAMNEGRVHREVGTFKNGKPKMLYRYPCNACKKEFDAKEIQVDHIKPVVDKSVGFQGFDAFIEGLLCCDIDNLQRLCKRCHKIKTKRENS